MIREPLALVLAPLLFFVCGPLVWLAGLWSRNDGDAGRPEALESRRWLAVWFPYLPAAMAASALVGWAVTEDPIIDEALHPIAVWLAVFVALWWTRAILRCLRALARPKHEPLAATFGLVRPRVHIGAELAAVLDDEERAAVEQHERAHARHFDPLRIWLAQLATDLQLPTRAARARLDLWLTSLEIARDAEARRAGADGAALASAVVSAARLQAASSRPHPACGVLGAGALQARVARLLAPLPPIEIDRVSIGLRVGLVLSLLGIFAVGVALGDDIVRNIPGVLY